MATQAPPQHTPSSGMEEARSALASALSGTPAPAPAESTPVPAPPESAPAPPAPPATSAAPEPSGTPAPASSISDPAARRFLEMNGGDLERALSKALRDNNRLAELARVSPELFKPGAVADPAHPPQPAEPRLFDEPPPATPSAVEPPQVFLDPNVIQAHVNQAVHQDAESTAYIREWINNRDQLTKFSNDRSELMSRIAYNEAKLKDPDFSPDDLRRGPVENEIARLQNQLGLVEAREGRLQMQQERLGSRFDARQAQLRQAIESSLQQQAEEEAFTAYEQSLEAEQIARTRVEWPSALDRCIRENNIPPEQVEDFRADAVRAFEAAMGRDPNLVIQDMYAFLSPVAKAVVARLDRYHRVRSTQYATAAATRAATPSPATGPGTAPPPVPAKSPTPEEAMAEATHYLRQRLRG